MSAFADRWCHPSGRLAILLGCLAGAARGQALPDDPVARLVDRVAGWASTPPTPEAVDAAWTLTEGFAAADFARSDVQDAIVKIGMRALEAARLPIGHEAFRCVLAHRERTLDSTSSALADARRWLGVTKARMGRVHEALPLFEADYAARVADPDVAPEALDRAAMNLAAIRQDTGDLVGSFELGAELLRRMERTRDADDHLLQQVRFNQSGTLRDLGRPEEALDLARAVLATWVRTLPEGHGHRVDAALLVADLETQLGRFEDADGHFSQALDALGSLSPEHPRRVEVDGQRARSLQIRGAYVEARELWRRIYAFRLAQRPPQLERLNLARVNLGGVLRQLDELDEAEELLRTVIEELGPIRPEDHGTLMLARRNLAMVAADRGREDEALAELERLLAIRERTEPEGAVRLSEERTNLAVAWQEAGRLSEAKDMFERVLATYERQLGSEHLKCHRMRMNLGVVERELGRPRVARELIEPALSVFERVQGAGHRDVLLARQNLATCFRDLGDNGAAAELFESNYRELSSSLPPTNRRVLRALVDVGVALQDFGDLRGAVHCFDRGLEGLIEVLGPGHVDVAVARSNLAASKLRLGDLHGGLSLLRDAKRAFERRGYPPFHPEILRTRRNIGAVLHMLGETDAACEEFEALHRVHAERDPEGSPTRLRAMSNYAVALSVRGDSEGALDLEERVLAAVLSTHDSDHPEVQTARENLAGTLLKLGEVDRGIALLRESLAARRRTWPSTSPLVQRSRMRLLHGLGVGERFDAACDLAVEAAAAARARIARQDLTAREAGAAARQEFRVASWLATLATRAPVDRRREARWQLAAILGSIRGAEVRATRARRDFLRNASADVAALERRLRAAAARVQSAYERDDSPNRDVLRARIGEKERLERELAALVPGVSAALDADAFVRSVAASLTAPAAAVAFLEYRPHPLEDPTRSVDPSHLGAVVLFSAAAGPKVVWVELGPLRPIRSAIARPRGDVWGLRGDPIPSRSPRGESWTALGRRLLDPIVDVLPDSIDRLVVSASDVLQLVPLDALKLADGRYAGDRFVFENVLSLADLAVGPARADVSERPSLLVMGGIDYGADSSPAMGDRDREAFPPLANSGEEARQIAAAFRAEFGVEEEDVRCRLHTGVEASRTEFLTRASAATFLHVATHGYFAPESVPRAAEFEPFARFEFGPTDAASALSPLVLSGLAFAGANLPPDEFGRREGILTAEDLLGLDLSGCYLATLSACETSLGVRRAGQGFASLRSALQGAGARFVLCSLWKVQDAHTREWMDTFYRELWRGDRTPHEALWRAKMSSRAAGRPVRDWAGWVLVGR